MFQLSYSESTPEHRSDQSDADTRLEIDLESLEKWVIANSGDGEPFTISPQDILHLIHEAMYWRDQSVEAHEELMGSQDMIEDLLFVTESNRKSAQNALGMIR